MQTIKALCKPRESVFDDTSRDDWEKCAVILDKQDVLRELLKGW